MGPAPWNGRLGSALPVRLLPSLLSLSLCPRAAAGVQEAVGGPMSAPAWEDAPGMGERAEHPARHAIAGGDRSPYGQAAW